jgi:hypothetical protein
MGTLAMYPDAVSFPIERNDPPPPFMVIGPDPVAELVGSVFRATNVPPLIVVPPE